MSQVEKSLIIIKPDAVQRGLVGEIISRFERKGMHIAGMKMITIGDDMIQEHYRDHLSKPFFGSLKKFMQSAPAVVMCVSGLDAVAAIRIIVGKTNGREADAGSIRGDLAMGMNNLVHASDTFENGQREVAIFFKDEELVSYPRTMNEWIYAEDEKGLVL